MLRLLIALTLVGFTTGQQAPPPPAPQNVRIGQDVKVPKPPPDPGSPMAALTKAIAFNIGTGAAGTTVYVNTGFEPKFMRFTWTGDIAVSNGSRVSHQRGHGFAVAPGGAGTVFSQTNYDSDNLGNAIAKSDTSADACILLIDNTGSPIGAATLQSVDSTGFTLSITDAFPTNIRVHAFVVGGDEITNYKLTGFGFPGSTGTYTHTGVGFQGDITFFMLASGGADSKLMFGAATDNNQAVHWSGSNDTAGTADAGSYNRSGACIVFHATSPTVSPTNRAAFLGHTADGFQINVLERANSHGIVAVTLQGGDWNVGSFDTNTNTTDKVVSGLAHRPTGAIFVSAASLENLANSTPTVHDEWSEGYTDGTTQLVAQTASRDGNTNTFTFRSMREDSVYINADPVNSSYVLEGRMSFTSFNSDGFTLATNDADDATNHMWWVTVGSTVTGGTTASGVGSATGSSSVSGVGKSRFRATGVSAGVSSVSGVGKLRFKATGASTGTATVTGVGKSGARATGAATGTSLVTGSAKSRFRSIGSATGTSDSNAVGAATSRSTGSAIGTSTGLGESRTFLTAVGLSQGTATGLGEGRSLALATGSAAGTSATLGEGRSTASGTGFSAGVSIVNGFSSAEITFPAAGTSTGTSTVSGVGKAIFRASGLAQGSSSADGFARAFQRAIGSAAGTSTALGFTTSQVIISAVGLAEGTSDSAGVGQSIFRGLGASEGSSTVVGFATSVIRATGAAFGTSTTTGVAKSLQLGVGSAVGLSEGLGISQARAWAVGESFGTSVVTGIGRALGLITPPEISSTIFEVPFETRTFSTSREFRIFEVPKETRTFEG